MSTRAGLAAETMKAVKGIVGFVRRYKLPIADEKRARKQAGPRLVPRPSAVAPLRHIARLMEHVDDAAAA